MASEAEDPAAQAFEALRRDVASLRDDIKRIADPIDYSPTLQSIVQRLEDLKKPALSRSPIADTAAHEAANFEQARLLSGLKQQISALEGVVGRARDRRQWWVGIGLASLGGALIGAACCVALAGPIARTFPSVSYAMAKAALGQVRWDRGIRFMAHADDATWNQVATGLVLVQTNAAALDKCAKAASRGKSRTCQIQVPEPAER
ncbi:MAG: hypothetical protein B7Y78_00135 [Caulobacter sp. 35-67-4]|nr:MAG: hypothetical protein B7Y78_00135 [Caulobacter sp. 35-67-4]HQR87703.1 DUF6118 family protein [Caulobacter sp.]